MNCTDHMERTPLHFAAANGSIEAIKMLIAHGGADLTKKNCMEETPYDVAIKNKHPEAAELFKP